MFRRNFMSILKKFLPLLNRTSRCHWYHRVELRGVIDTAEFVIDTLEFYMTPQSQLSFIARNYQHQFLKSLKPKAEAKDEPYSKIQACQSDGHISSPKNFNNSINPAWTCPTCLLSSILREPAQHVYCPQ